MKSRKPAWWPLYLIPPSMLALMIVEHLAPLPGPSDQAVDAGIVVLGFIAMLVWVQFNGGLLERYELDRDDARRSLNGTFSKPPAKTEGDEQESHDLTRSSLQRQRMPGDPLELTLRKENDEWFLN